MGYIPFEEPFQKMINQGMIQGNSAYIAEVHFSIAFWREGHDLEKFYDENPLTTMYVASEYIESDFVDMEKECHKLMVEKFGEELMKDVELTYASTLRKAVPIDSVSGNKLNIEKYIKWSNAGSSVFLKNKNGDFTVEREVEKMSKSKYNVQTPDELVDKYGADTLRCYEMFLGPLEQHKPWDTQGITGVNGFLKKLWRLFHDDNGLNVSDETPTKEELKSLHKTIKKVKEDIERFAFNTPVSTYMICVNELTALKCNKKDILQDLLIILSPYAPHIAEELWAKLGNKESITYAVFPKHNDAYLVESNHKYPVSFNGKMRFMLELPTNMKKEDVEAAVMANEQTLKYLAGQTPKKVIVVPNKIVNFVV